MYKEYKKLNLPEIDTTILEFWKAQNVFERSIEERDIDNSFVFYEGPPSANGKPGIHHVMARTVKDLFCRFQTLNGKRVARKGGWDTHGLPIELSVEKELGITKEDIGKTISIADYNAKCRETVMRYTDLWDSLTIKMGYWVDLEHPYITYKNEYIESVWNLLQQIYNKKLLYKGYTIQPYSPAAGTGLSTHELNQPGAYREVTDTTVTAQFRIVSNEKSAFLYDAVTKGDVYILAWTTTPWTLPSNTALAVGAKINYSLISTFNPYTKEPVNVIIAKDLISAYFKLEQAELSLEDYQASDKMIPFRVLKEFKGTELADLDYEQLLPFQQPTDGDAFRIIIGDYVSTADGTGIVHIAPSFGADDRRVAQKNGIGSLTLVDKQGRFIEDAGPYSGRYVKDYKDDPDYQEVDVDIAIQLKKENKAFNVQKYQHNYPHCWRTDKPILYYPLDSWFIKTTAVKDRMVALNNTIHWHPESTGTGRFGNWLENVQDWNLSRSRFWGIPLPIWRTEDGTQERCIGTIDELTTAINEANTALGLDQKTPEDLHRPYIDDITLVSEDGRPMTRELDLIDVWFDSGSMPYAQWHYPFENQDKFERNFPADFIAEGVDQTRGWFYTLHAISTIIKDSIAYRNVVSNGLVLDKNGQKMSKRLGNAVDPFETLDTYGADATRWYMISNAPPWNNLKFDLDGIAETQRKFFGTLFSTYNFFAIYANVDNFVYDEAKATPIKDRPEIDRWILSKLNSLNLLVKEAFESYNPTNACRAIEDFCVDQLSNWFVRLSRRRFWKSESSDDKKAAFETLFECLLMTTQLMSPVAPFFSDWLYKNLTDHLREQGLAANTLFQHESIHLTYLAQANTAIIDSELEIRMEYAQRISSLVLSLRKKEGIRVRQPLRKILIPIVDDNFNNRVQLIADLIKSEVNIKEIDMIADTAGFITKKIKPNFKTLGKRLGKNMKSVGKAIPQFNQDTIQRIEQEGGLTLVIGDESYDLTLDDFDITYDDIEGWLVANDKEITVALDVTLDDALKYEGLAREIVNRIQNIRKDMGLEVTDRVEVAIEDTKDIRMALGAHGNYIQNEVLANEIRMSDGVSGEPIDLVDDVSVKIQVEKV